MTVRLTELEKAIKAMCDHLDIGIIATREEFTLQLASLVLNWYRDLER